MLPYGPNSSFSIMNHSPKPVVFWLWWCKFRREQKPPPHGGPVLSDCSQSYTHFWLVSPCRWDNMLRWWQDIPRRRTVAEGISRCYLLLHMLWGPAGKALCNLDKIRRSWVRVELLVCMLYVQVGQCPLRNVEAPHFLLAHSCLGDTLSSPPLLWQPQPQPQPLPYPVFSGCSLFFGA